MFQFEAAQASQAFSSRFCAKTFHYSKSDAKHEWALRFTDTSVVDSPSGLEVGLSAWSYACYMSRLVECGVPIRDNQDIGC